MDAARSTYSRGAIAFHWAIGVLMILNLLGGLFHDAVPRESIGLVMGLHKATGILILFLTIGRLVWRLTHRPPPLPATVKSWEKGLAHATHWTFYLLMFALPITGWLMVSAGERKYPFSFYGLFDIPYLPVLQDKVASHIYEERHEFLGYIAAALVVLHIAAALKHHLFDRDDTVVRMLPLLRR